MKSWKTKIEIHAPIQTVWETLIDFTNASKWNPNVSSSTILTPMPVDKGTRVEVKSGGRQTYLTITEFKPNNFLSANVEMGKTIGTSEFFLQSVDNSTILEHTIHLELKGIARLFSIFIAGSLKKEFQAMRAWTETKKKN
ncbi:MAG: SRPBCC family protein [Nitrospiraceae bacterium]|nr:SRPBCC family protein [Nitrospiraceae bacterium]